jgi:hypothetical protein
MISMRKVAKRVLPNRVVMWIRRRRAAKKETEGVVTVSHRPRLGRREPSVEHIIGREVMLFSTGSQSHARELASSLRSVTAGSEAHIRGTLALARWSLHQGRPDDAVRHLDQVAPPSNHALRMAVDLCRVDCQCAMGDGKTALSLLSKILGRQTGEHNLALRVGHARSLFDVATDHGSGPMVEALNTIYHGAGLGLLRRTLVIAPIGLGNISSEVPDAEPKDHLPRVTVVVRLPDGLTDIVGISSVLGQSWRNLEVLVVAGADARDRLTALDPTLSDDNRVVFVDDTLDNDHPLMPGLTHGTGDLMTTHPSDSWAHPQRIEAQASVLIVDPGVRGTVSSHVYVGDHLVPRPLGIVPKEDLVGPNPHSVMLRVAGREADEVLAEYDRIQANHSPVTGEFRMLEGIDLVNDDVPLTLSREGSLL